MAMWWVCDTDQLGTGCINRIRAMYHYWGFCTTWKIDNFQPTNLVTRSTDDDFASQIVKCEIDHGFLSNFEERTLWYGWSGVVFVDCISYLWLYVRIILLRIVQHCISGNGIDVVRLTWFFSFSTGKYWLVCFLWIKYLDIKLIPHTLIIGNSKMSYQCQRTNFSGISSNELYSRHPFNCIEFNSDVSSQTARSNTSLL